MQLYPNKSGEETPASWLHRLTSSGIALACAGPLIVAAMLTPSSDGVGTHTQMGLPECGFKLATGYPCATCGCTTAFAHAADGSFLTSLMTQPFGAVLALSLSMLALIAGWSALSGMRLDPLGQFMASRGFVLSWIVLLLAAWGYKAAAVAIIG
ncbi:MAG: DUF2752 domain-containing protein [Planctomycetota bacterium]